MPGLRIGEILSLGESNVDRKSRFIIPNCHSGETKHSGISFYNEEAEALLEQFEKSKNIWQRKSHRLFSMGRDKFFYSWKRAKEKSGINMRPKDLRDFFSQEMGKALIPDRYINIFEGRAPKNVLAKHHNPHGIKMLRGDLR